MRSNKAFNDAVLRFLVALRAGDNVDVVWNDIIDESILNDADLQWALQRAETLEAETAVDEPD